MSKASEFLNVVEDVEGDYIVEDLGDNPFLSDVKLDAMGVNEDNNIILKFSNADGEMIEAILDIKTNSIQFLEGAIDAYRNKKVAQGVGRGGSTIDRNKFTGKKQKLVNKSIIRNAKKTAARRFKAQK